MTYNNGFRLFLKEYLYFHASDFRGSSKVVIRAPLVPENPTRGPRGTD
jgi:hypothetical protein